MKLSIIFVALVVCFLIAGFILQYSVKWIAKFKPKYITALKANIYVWISGILLSVLYGFIEGYRGETSGAQFSQSRGWGSLLFVFIIELFIATAVYSYTLKHMEKKPVTLSQASLITIAQAVVYIVAVIIIITARCLASA